MESHGRVPVRSGAAGGEGRAGPGRAVPLPRLRKHHGAVFYASAIFVEAAVTISGETRVWKSCHFCPTCGSSVFGRSCEEVEVMLEALDQPGVLAPTYENLDGAPRVVAAGHGAGGI